MADTTQPAGALPEPAGQIRLPGAFGLACDGYTADQMRAMMAERDAALARAEFCLAFTRDAQALCATAQEEAAALRQELEELRAIPPDAREGREPLPASYAEFWLANRSKILDAIAREGLTLVSNRYGFELLRLGKFEAQGGPAGTSAEEAQP